MSQPNYQDWLNETGDPERAQPRYQPLNAHSERPSDWPAPDGGPTAPTNIPPSQGSWGAYQPGAPVYGNPPPYGNPPQPQPYNYNEWAGGYYNNANNGSYFNNANTGGYYQLPRRDRGYRQHRYRYAMPLQPSQPLDPRQLAERRVNARLRFYRHVKTYVLVNAFLWLIALMTIATSHAHFWPVYITLFWGCGLFFEYRRVFGHNDQQRRQLIEEEMRRIK